MFGHDYPFYIAIGVALLVKLITSRVHSLWQAAASVASGLFAAVFFTDMVLHIGGLSPAEYKIPVAALLALTGEGLVKWVLGAADNPEKTLFGFLKAWRSK
ncbi:MAG: hypothetical protein AAF468_19880 [Pseudomonadota bacterium]